MVLVLVMLPLMKYFCGLDLKSKTSEIKLAQFWVRFGYVPKFNSEFLFYYMNAYPLYIDEYSMYI